MVPSFFKQILLYYYTGSPLDQVPPVCIASGVVSLSPPSYCVDRSSLPPPTFQLPDPPRPGQTDNGYT